MPKQKKIRGISQPPTAKVEDAEEGPEGRQSLSLGSGPARTFSGIGLAAARDRARVLGDLMGASRNPSTVFKPPFGTNADEHHSRLGEHAQNLWQYNQITDVTVKLEGADYPCHKTVLSCYSKYFKQLLLDQKGTVSVVQLRLPSVTRRAFEVLLTYMYTSKLNLTCQNIGEVYTASRKLGIDGALVLCTRVLTGQTKYGVHSVYVYVTAKRHGMDDCAAKALKIMTRRFEQIVGTPEFLDLDFEQVMEYLGQDALAARSEIVVYLSALKWLSVKWLDREPYAAALLRRVRFQMMTLNEVLACFSPPLLPGLIEQKGIKDQLLAATCYVAAKTVNEESRFERYACRPRRYLLPRETLILWDTSIFDPERHALYVEEVAATVIQSAYRGYRARKALEEDILEGRVSPTRRFTLRNLARLDAFETPAEEEDEVQEGRRGSVSSVFGNIRRSVVSLFSGRSEEEKSRRSEEVRSEPQKKEDEMLSSKPPSSAAVRRSSSIDTLAGHVNDLAESTELKKYTSDTAVDMNSAEFQHSFPLEPKTVHKIYSTPQKDGRGTKEGTTPEEEEAEMSATDLPKSFILVTGGFMSDSAQAESEGKMMYAYDPNRNKWCQFGTMGKARHHHVLVCLNEEVYFIGGCNPSKTMKSGQMVPERICYKLSLSSKEWTRIRKMNHCRMYHGAVALGDKIYVVGGKDESDSMLSSIEVYDSASDAWGEMQPALDAPLMGMGLCIHRGKLWIVGGMVQDDNGDLHLLSKVTVFDIEKRKKSKVSRDLPVPRAFSTSASCDGAVFAVGGTSEAGRDPVQHLSSVSDVLYITDQDKAWIPTASLPYERHFVQLAVIGDRLFVLGGLSSFEKSAGDQVLVYDKRERVWRPCAPIPAPLCGFAAVAVQGTEEK